MQDVFSLNISLILQHKIIKRSYFHNQHAKNLFLDKMSANTHAKVLRHEIYPIRF